MRTVATVRSVALASRVVPAVRNKAVEITGQCGRGDFKCQALAIARWVKAHLRFVVDPRDAELVQAPELLVRRIERDGQAAGDCDDAATLAAALDLSIGLSPRLVVASYRTDLQLHHVWTDAAIPVQGGKTGWVMQDPFRSETFGAEPTRQVFVRV